MKHIAIGGSAANPPHLGHRFLIETLLISNRFDQVIWIPSGVRKDKPGFIDPRHRIAMTHLTFPTAWFHYKNTEFTICLSDVSRQNTPTIEVMENYSALYPDAKIVWFTGVDSVVPEDSLKGKCLLQTWIRGEELYRKYHFLILPRPGYPNPRELKLPPNFEILNVPQLDIASSDIREKIKRGESIEGLVTPEVAAYIQQHELYQ